MKPPPWKKLVYPAILLALTGVLAGGSWLVLDYAHAQQDWVKFRDQRLAQGDHLDWNSLQPPEVPDAENFAKAPLIARAVQPGDGPSPFEMFMPVRELQNPGDWTLGRRTDLAAITQALHAPPLQALAPFAGTLKELDAASLRPGCWFPGTGMKWQTLRTPGELIKPQVALSLRATANLNQGDSAAALEDVLTSLRIADHFKTEPLLLVQAIRRVLVAVAIQPVWEGLLDRRWSESQLALIQGRLQQVDLLASARLAAEGTRARAIAHATSQALGQPAPDEALAQAPSRPGWLAKGLLYRRLVEHDRFMATGFQDSIQPDAHRVLPGKWADARHRLKGLWFRKDFYAELEMEVRATQVFVENAARTQALIDQAAVACALERHRLAKGAYPAALEALSPAFMARIPTAVIGGRPLRYQRQGNGFLLSSPGWEGEEAATSDGDDRWTWITEAR
jgi:hypothetical protein